MEGLLPASGLTCQLILERLWGALLVIAESWGYLSGLLAVHWGTLAGCVQMFLSVPWDNLAGFVQILSTIRTAWNSQCTEAQGEALLPAVKCLETVVTLQNKRLKPMTPKGHLRGRPVLPPYTA